MALLAGAWGVAILGLFFQANPFPVRFAPLLSTLRDLLAATLLLLLAARMGRLALRLPALGGALGSPGARLLHGTALGYGALSMAAFALAAAGLLRPVPLAFLAAAALATGGRDLREVAGDLVALRRDLGRMFAGLPARLLLVALGVAASLMLLEALAPPTAYDALRYHLRLPRLYADAGGLVAIPYDFNAAFPQNVDLLYAVAMAAGAPGAAGLTHLILGWLATGAVALLASRTAGLGGGLAAAAVFYTMPVVALNSAWAYVDLALALFVLLGVDAVRSWVGSGGAAQLARAGVLAGLALGTKYTGAAAVVVLCAWVAARPLARSLPPLSWRRALAGAALVGGLSLLVASPWLLRNEIQRGNPVYPFASSIFGKADGDTYRAERHQAVLGRPEVPAGSAADLLRLPWRFSAAPWVRDELVGPALLVLAPAFLLTRGGGAGGLVALAAAFGGIWFVLSPQVRLYVHGLGLLAAAAGASWATAARTEPLAIRRAVSWAGAAALSLSLLQLAVLQRGLSDPFPVVAGMEGRDHYLRRMVDGHEAIEYLNRELPSGSRVLFVGEVFGYYCRVPYLLGSKFDRAPIVDQIAAAGELPAFLEWLKREGFTHVLYSMAQLRKFADLPGRYLDWPDDRSRAVYRAFMTSHLEPVFEHPDAVVSRIVFDPARAAPPGPDPDAGP